MGYPWLWRLMSCGLLRYTLEMMNGTRRKSFDAELDKEIQSSSTTKFVEKNAVESEGIIHSVKPKSIASKDKRQVTSENPTKLESKRRRTKVNDLYNDTETQVSVTERAHQVLSSLKNEFPCFPKYMLPSNVCSSFWMILPSGFCKLYMPKCDSTVTLVDERGFECKTTYLFLRRGLSAGWRGFSISHKLLKGDILIFQMIDYCKFKVHIVRVYKADVIDAACCLMDMADSSETTDSDLGKKKERKRKRKNKYTYY